MSLLNSLYYLVESKKHEGANSEAVYVVRFDATHPIFAGHFPGHPIVPGACLVQLAEELAGMTIGQPIRFTALRNLKFRQPVTPEQQVRVSIEFQDSNFKIQISDLTNHKSQIVNSASFSATYMCLDSNV